MEIISEQRPRHKWLVEHRQLLCIFTKLYGNSIQDLTSILNHTLATELRAEGFRSGVPTSTVQWQLQDMQQGSSGYDIWRNVIVNASISEARKTFREDRDIIEDAALALGIGLHLRTEEVDRSKPHGRRLGKRARKIEEIRGVLGDLVSSSDDSESDPHNPGNRRKSSSIETPPGTSTRQGQSRLLTPISRQSGGTTPGSLRKTSSVKKTATTAKHVSRNVGESASRTKGLPKLCFRWYNNQSQGLNTPTELRAGRFLDKSQEIPPPEWDPEAVRNHLVPHKLPSPFISFRESLRPCIFRALKAGVDTNACITAVDLQKLRDISVQKWGHDNAVKACPDLIKNFELRLGRRSLYTGGGEWLVHGKIDKEAIVTTFMISDFIYHENRIPLMAQLLRLDIFRAAPTAGILSLRLSESPGDMTWHSGVAVGLLLKNLGFPEEYRNDFGAHFAQSWRLRGYTGQKPNKEYMSGLFHPEDSRGSPYDVEDEMMMNNEDDDRVSGSSKIIMAEQIILPDFMKRAREQDLIDAQLHAELASVLQEDALYKTSPTSNDTDETPSRSDARPATTKSQHESLQDARPAQLTHLRSSSLFTWRRPNIPNPATDWEARNSREVSPAATELSALDTFTTELLAKAEEVSTVGSFGRGPSTIRGVSEVQSARSGEGEEERNERAEWAESAWQEDSDVIDLSSDDDDDDDSVEDLGFEIVGSRVI